MIAFFSSVLWLGSPRRYYGGAVNLPAGRWLLERRR
jgi:hypothetical protein